MVEEIVPYGFEGENIRTQNIQGELWFSTRDVCGVLSCKEADLLAETETWELRLPLRTSLVQAMEDTGFINEGGLYSFLSKRAGVKAKKLKKWVNFVAVPSVRKIPEVRKIKREENPEGVLKALSFWEDERKKWDSERITNVQ